MTRDKLNTTKVFVAMSGGVDSSVAALLLKRQGFRVVGVFMKPYQAPGLRCLWRSDRQDAMRVAAHLDIPLKTWDFSREYGRCVTRYMIDGYRRGITPNPDVMCNKEIKFGLFFKRALREGADMVATGHYARTVRKDGRTYLAKAKDANKDQTYFLWAISPRCLERTLFPVGSLTKPLVRALARRAGLSVADKKDSQGVCFIGDIDMKSFLVGRIKPRPGRIFHVDGRPLGWHDGAMYYTVGQRHGLGIADGCGPHFVVRTDVRKNVVVVGPADALNGRQARMTETNWFGPRPKPSQKVQAKIRFRTSAVSAAIDSNNRITFSRSVRAITAGQSAVIYCGQRLIGGGTIASST